MADHKDTPVIMAVHPAADLFPMLDEKDLAALAEDIKANGLLEPVWLYDDPDHGTVILDGRNRAAACALAGVQLQTRTYTGPDPIRFAVSVNMQRRHLTAGQKAAVAFEVLPLYEEAGRKEMARAVAEENRRRAEREAAERSKSQPTLDANPGVADLPHLEPTAKPKQKKARAPISRDKAAEATGTSGRAVAQFKRIAEQAPDLADKVKSGEIALDRAERIIRDREAESRRVKEAQREASLVGTLTTVDLRLGDFRDVLADVRDLDAIITDPPYPREFIPLMADLAAWADAALKPDGVLVILMGQTYLPDVYRLLEGGRPYRWTGAYMTPGAGYASKPRKLQSNWKPLLVYGGGPRFADVFESRGSDADAKNNHKWGQDYGAFHEIVRRFTKAGDVIADPFMGAGTTLLAGKALGRHVIGAELEQEHFDTAQRRLEDTP